MDKKNNKSIPVMVTGVGGGGHGEQIIKALRLAETPYHIIGTDISAESAGFARVDEGFVVPRADHPDYLKTILSLCERLDVRALFHGSEPEMMLMSRNAEQIRQKGIYLPVNPPQVLNICQDKARTMEFLTGAGFKTPRFMEIRSLEQVDEVDFYPVVLKPSVQGGGSANVFIVQDAGELKTFAAYLLRQAPVFILQEYVGTPEEEYTVGVLFGGDGELLNSIAVHRTLGNALSIRTRVRNRTSRSYLGPWLVISSGVSQGKIGRFEVVTGPCEFIARALGPRAPVNIQCRFVDGEVVPFEINPRFSGTTSLRAMVGYNEPDVLIRRDVLGEKIKSHFPYSEDLIMRGLEEFFPLRSTINVEDVK